MELLLGCGNRRRKYLYTDSDQFRDLVTLDMNPDHKPDVVWDMETIPLPFEDNSASEIHAYEVLEHMGRQGDWRFFFAQFEDFWRILKPGGMLFATTPHPSSPWAWGDPGHTRVLPPECLTYLCQEEYVKQVGVTPITDYRHWYKGDFRIDYAEVSESRTFRFSLKALK